jgi:Protein of unknown function (DUF429)
MSVPKLFGVDFSSAPTKKKPITVASGRLASWRGQQALCVEGVSPLFSLDEFSEWLALKGPWVAGFDLPFALPREFLQTVGWPHSSWQEHIAHVETLSRSEMVQAFKAFCDSRPVGGKFAHRRCDIPAGSSPSMKWVNPPVAYMLHAGATRLLRAGVYLPILHQGDVTRVSLEAYPGFFARTIAGRNSYKSDDIHKQDEPRKLMREAIVQAMEDGRNALSLMAKFEEVVRQQCIEDASGDALDACICLLQAAWGEQRRDKNFGLPVNIDPVEGWIVTVPHVMTEHNALP